MIFPLIFSGRIFRGKVKNTHRCWIFPTVKFFKKRLEKERLVFSNKKLHLFIWRIFAWKKPRSNRTQKKWKENRKRKG